MRDPSVLTVAERRCDQCLFSSARIVNEQRVEEILEKCRRDGTAFECHRFTMVGEHAVCRAFFDRRESLVVRLGIMLERVRFVPLPPKP